jgi:hypothetical protein
MNTEKVKSMNPKRECWERIEAVIRWAGTNASALGRRLGMPDGKVFHRMKKGYGNISVEIANKICRCFPEINKLWLLTGEGTMLRDNMPFATWLNVNTPEGHVFRAWATVQLLPIFIEKGAPDPAAAALAQVDKLQELLAKEGGKQ